MIKFFLEYTTTMTTAPITPVPNSDNNKVIGSSNNNNDGMVSPDHSRSRSILVADGSNMTSMITSPNSSSPRRSRSVADHLALLSMIRSKSASDADIPELKNITALAQTLRSGVDHNIHRYPSTHTHKSHHHHHHSSHSSQLNYEQVSTTGSDGGNSASSSVGTGTGTNKSPEIPYFPRITHSENDIVKLNKASIRQLDIDRIEEESLHSSSNAAAVCSSREATITSTSSTTTTPSITTPPTLTTPTITTTGAVTATTMMPTSSNHLHHRYRSTSVPLPTNDYNCRVGIVVSDYDVMMAIDKSLLSAMANPISKCVLCSFVILNIHNNQTESFVRNAAKEFIYNNYIIVYQRHQKYNKATTTHQKNSSGSTDSSNNFNKSIKRRQNNLDYHSTEYLRRRTSTDGPTIYDAAPAATATESTTTKQQQQHLPLPRANTSSTINDDGDDSDEYLMIDETTYIHILIGNDGFKRLLDGRAGVGIENNNININESIPIDTNDDDINNNDNNNNSGNNNDNDILCPFVDTIYSIIPDSKKQHEYAIQALNASKHILLHDPISTSLYDFCDQFHIARQKNCFLQFSTMFVHQYRIKTFLDCVSDSIGFGKIESIDVILNVNYNDTKKVGVTYPPQSLSDNCIHRLGRYCVLITSIMLSRSVLYSNSYFPFNNEQQREEDHRPLKAHVLSYTTMEAASVPLPSTSEWKTNAINNEDIIDHISNNNSDNHRIDIPVAAKCLVEFTNDRTLTFSVQYSAAPTRQVLTVRANGRYATISDFVIPHPDGLSTCRLYDAERTIVVPYHHRTTTTAAANNETTATATTTVNPPTVPGGLHTEDDMDSVSHVDVVCGEAVDMPSGPPQDVIMFRRFCELSRAIQQEGWDIKDDTMTGENITNNTINNEVMTHVRPPPLSSSIKTTSSDSIGYDVNRSRHSASSNDYEFINTSITGGENGMLTSSSSDNNSQLYYPQMPSLTALEAQEARDITDVAIQTKSILGALEKSCHYDTNNQQQEQQDGSGVNKNKRQGVPVPVELPNVW